MIISSKGLMQATARPENTMRAPSAPKPLDVHIHDQ
jgi:hypothetical protein